MAAAEGPPAAKRAPRLSLFPQGAATPAHRRSRQSMAQAAAAEASVLESSTRDTSAALTPTAVSPELLNTTWKAYRLTPLHAFHTDTVHFKSYAQSLTAALRAEAHRGEGVALSLPESEGSAATDSALVARIAILKDVAINDDDPEAVLITVEKPSSRGGQSVALKLVLCSVGAPARPSDAALKGTFSKLPVGLLKGSVAVARQVFNWLQMSFDCAVVPMTFTPVDLVWMAAEWAAAEAGDAALAQRALALTYRPPDSVSQISEIVLSVEPDSVRRLLDSIDSDTGALAQGDRALLERLEQHIFATFRLKLAAMRLSRVATFAIFVGADGRLKFLTLPEARQEDTLLALNYITYVAVRDSLGKK